MVRRLVDRLSRSWLPVVLAVVVLGLLVAIAAGHADPLAAYTLVIATLALGIELFRIAETAPRLEIRVEWWMRGSVRTGVVVRAWNSGGGTVQMIDGGFGVENDQTVQSFPFWSNENATSRIRFEKVLSSGGTWLEGMADIRHIAALAKRTNGGRLPTHVFVEDVARNRSWRPLPPDVLEAVRAEMQQTGL